MMSDEATWSRLDTALMCQAEKWLTALGQAVRESGLTIASFTSLHAQLEASVARPLADVERRSILYQAFLEVFGGLPVEPGEILRRDFESAYPDVCDLISKAWDDIARTRPSENESYTFLRHLGSGAFASATLANDRRLGRKVVLKRLLPSQMADVSARQLFIDEAKKLARINHPHVRQIYDVQEIGSSLLIQVLEYVEGPTLAEFLKTASRLPSIGWVNDSFQFGHRVAEALEEVHREGLYHLDLKPDNILLTEGSLSKPKVADFGLSLTRDERWSMRGAQMGTPCYMAPEQFEGNTVQVDGRTDAWALGVILYEMMTAQVPFGGRSLEEVQHLIQQGTHRPIREWNPDFPFCSDLDALFDQCFQKQSTARCTMRALKEAIAAILAEVAKTLDYISGRPQGLSSFTELDHEYFLRLLPGQRDEHSIPFPISQWLLQIDKPAAVTNGFKVALIHGPSGCGKSSLVKAGLLPLLAAKGRQRRIVSIDIDATPDRTESELLSALQSKCKLLPAHWTLEQSLRALSEGRFLDAGVNVVLFIDQFEQWLQDTRIDDETPLVRALKFCNGVSLQAIVIVREDYWTAVSQFMAAVDIRLKDGVNKFFIDLFQPAHARKVLELFGQGYGKFPAGVTAEHGKFLDSAVHVLTNKGRVICVQLALFAKMFEDKPWTPVALHAIDGMKEVGIQFLDESFVNSERQEYQDYRKSAETLLEALLPEDGTDLKGHMRPSSELVARLDMASRPRQFERLIAILDFELRLIKSIRPKDGNAEICLQLTHDYLVPPLRDWLSRQQEKSEEGRAYKLIKRKGMLFEHSDFGSRSLPSLAEIIQIGKWVPERHRTPQQREMMAMASLQHAHATAERIVACSTDAFPQVLQEVEEYRTIFGFALFDRLRKEFRASTKARWSARRARNPTDCVNSARRQLHASVALVPADQRYVRYLYTRLLTCELDEIAILRSALFPFRERLKEPLWRQVHESSRSHEAKRLRAVAALVAYEPEAQNPESKTWQALAGRIVDGLVEVPAVHLSVWTDLLRPAAHHLRAASGALYRDRRRRETDRALAIAILAEYAADLPAVLAEYLVEADVEHFDVLFPLLEKYGEESLKFIRSDQNPDVFPRVTTEECAKRNANAEIARFRLGQAGVLWPLLRQSLDPRVRSYLIHRLAPCGVQAATIVERLQYEEDVAVCRALLLFLGTYDLLDLPMEQRARLVPELQRIYRSEPDGGVHGAAEWVLRRWGKRSWLTRMQARFAQSSATRLEANSLPDGGVPEWRVASRGQSFVVIPRNAEFMMGSPETEQDRKDEPIRRRVIPRSFAVAAKPVTWREFLTKWDWNEYLGYLSDNSQTEVAAYRARMEAEQEFEDSPVNFVSWHMAADYCNWLSRDEGLDECYVTKCDGKRMWTTLKPHYLQLTGYRLPTEAEMEYVTRAGSITARCFGESEELLSEYAWYAPNADNRTHGVGLLKPNEWGLFDVHGNCYTWCLDADKGYQIEEAGSVFAQTLRRVRNAAQSWFTTGEPDIANAEPAEDHEGDLFVGNSVRVLRGGMYFDQASDVRSAYRYHHKTTSTENFIGFRLARTLSGQPRQS